MKRIRACALLAGIVLLGFAIHKTGSGKVVCELRSLPWVLPIVIIAGVLRLWVQTRAWQIALRADEIEVSHSRLLGVRLAAQAGGYLAALGPVLAEPAKLAMLRDSATAGATAPATLVETGAYWLTTVVLGLAGAGAAWLLIPGSPLVWSSAAIFGVGFLFLVSRGAVLSPILRLASARAPNWLRVAEDTEIRIRSFRQRHPATSNAVLTLDAAAQLLTLAESACVLWVMGTHFSVVQILAVESASRLVKILSAWIPARIGADEGGAAASFAVLGLAPTTGLTLAFARRLRDLLLCAVGVAWAAARSREQANPKPRVISLCLQER